MGGVTAARSSAAFAMPFERNLPIWVCHGWKIPLEEAWRRGKHFI